MNEVRRCVFLFDVPEIVSSAASSYPELFLHGKGDMACYTGRRKRGKPARVLSLWMNVLRRCRNPCLFPEDLGCPTLKVMLLGQRSMFAAYVEGLKI